MQPVMSPFDAFRKEREVLTDAESLLGASSVSGLCPNAYSELLEHYRKLLKTSDRLVRISDRSEERLKEANHRIKRQQQKLESEIEFAKGIQMSMVPGKGRLSLEKTDYQLYAYLHPARSVGGDLYSFQPDDDRIHFLIGDVSDKGVPAALFMARTIALYNSALNSRLNPGEIFTTMNAHLCDGNEECMFVTALCGYFIPGEKRLAIANAGHMNPLMANQQDHAELELPAAAALGLMEGLEFGFTEWQIDENARLVMYTDGISEAMDQSSAQYGERRLFECIRKNSNATATDLGESILADVADFVGAAEQSDDITLLVLRAGG